MTRLQLLLINFVCLSFFTCDPKKQDCKKFPCEEIHNQNINYISFGYKYYDIGDRIKLDLDDENFKFDSGILNQHYYYENGKEYILRNYCSTKDSIKVQYWYNEKETSFYIKMHDVEECLLGTGKNVQVRIIYRDHKKN